LFHKNKFIPEVNKRVRKEALVVQWLRHVKIMARIRLLTGEL